MHKNTFALVGAITLVLLVLVGGCTSSQPVISQPVRVGDTPHVVATPSIDPIVGSYDAVGAPVSCTVTFYASNIVNRGTGHIDCGFFAQRDFNWYAKPTKGHYQVELEGSMYSGTLEPDGNVWSSALPSGTHLEHKN